MATGLTAGNAALEDDEVLELHPVSLARAVQMVRLGEIIDGKSMLGVLLAAARTFG